MPVKFCSSTSKYSVSGNRIQAKQFKYDMCGRLTQVFIDERGRGLPSKIEGYVYDDAGIRVRGGSMVLLGDFDMSAIADAFDADLLNLALADKTQYVDLYGVDPDYVGDMNESGSFDVYDITPYEDFLANGFPVQWLWVPGAKTYINDPLNPTGYSQVIEEWLDNGGLTLAESYAIAHDIVSQFTALPGADVVYFLYDTHGSTRALTDDAGAIIPGHIFDYKAFGQLLTHSPDQAAKLLTDILCSGEQVDAATGLSYLRGRYYRLSTGTFTRIDPTGWFTLTEASVASGIASAIDSIKVDVGYAVQDLAHGVADFASTDQVFRQFLFGVAVSGALLAISPVLSFGKAAATSVVHGAVEAARSGLKVVLRPRMLVRSATDDFGRAVIIYGKAHISSATPGHAGAGEALARRLAKSGDYEYITLNRSWRTATGRVSGSRKRPDIIAVRRNGKVDAFEIVSKTDDPGALRARLREEMNTLPPNRQGRFKTFSIREVINYLKP